MKKNNIPSLFLIIGFLAILILPTIDQFIPIDPVERINENRTLNMFPKLELESLNSFPDSYEAWHRDHFGFRNSLVSSHFSIRVSVLGLQPRAISVARFQGLGEDGSALVYPDVTIGKDGWIYYTSDHLMNWYRGIDGYYSDEIIQELWPEGLQKEAEIFENCFNAKLLYVIIPEKQSVYPEYMPDDIFRLRKTHNIDALQEYFDANPHANLLVLKDRLVAEKSNGRFLYHKADSHWNDYGALIGNQEIIEKTRQWFPEIVSSERSDFTAYQDTYFPDLIPLTGQVINEPVEVEKLRPVFEDTMIELESFYQPEEGYLSRGFRNENSELPTAVIFGDSFTEVLLPFMKHHFSRIIYYRDTPFDPAIIEAEKPDIVLRIMIERHGCRTIPGLDPFFNVTCPEGSID